MRKTLVLVTVILVGIILSLSMGIAGATWCDTDFAKRINVSVNNTGGGALTDYQVFVNLTTNPINKTSLRVYNTTDCTLRPHWCENETGGNCYGVWINYSAIATSTWVNNTAIYYENDAASSASNGTATFEFFDDFEDSVRQNYFLNDVARYGASSDVFGPQATYHNNRTYIVLHGADLDPYAIYYNHATSEWTDKVLVGTNPLGDDGHGSPSILRDASGYLHIFYGSHGSAQKYAKSTNPDNISAWTAMSDVVTAATYPTPRLASNGDIYLFYRTHTGGHYAYKKSSNGGSSWSGENIVIETANPGTDGVYIGSVEHEPGTPEKLHFGWMWYDKASGLPTEHKNVYYAYFNLSDSNMYNVSGTDLGTIISHTEGENSCKIYTDAPCHNIKVHLDSSGVPYIIFNNNAIYKFIKWTGSVWTTPQTITTTDTWQKSHDFIVHSSTNIEAYLDTSNKIENWTYNGATWSRVSFIANGSDYDSSVCLPAIVYNYTNNLKMTFSQGLAGNCNKAFAHGDGGFVKSTGTFGDISAWTIVVGSFAAVTSPVYYGSYAFGVESGSSTAYHDYDYNDKITEFWLRFSETGDMASPHISDDTADSQTAYIDSGYPTSGYWGYRDSSWHDSGVANAINTWYKIKLVLNSTAKTYDAYANGDTICEGISWRDSTSAANRLTFGSYSSVYDLVKVRGYASPEPSTTLGSEEQQGANPTLHIENAINMKEDWGRDFNSNFSANVTTANASGVWMNFSNAEFTNTSLGWVNLTLNEWVNESHNVNAPVTNVSVTVTLNSPTSGATNDTDSFYYEITNRTNTATMDSAATQNVDVSETFYVNATCNEEYGDTFLGGANLLDDGTIIDTDSSVTNYVNFSHSESSAGQYNYTVRFYNLTYYDNVTTPTYSNVTVAAPTYIPPNPTNLQNTSGDYWVNYTWDAGSGNVTDLYNISWNLTWYNDTSVTYMNDSVGASNWANISVWAYNSSSGGTLSAGSVSDEVKVSDAPPEEYIPPDPTTLANSTGNFWINHTYIMGTPGNVTDSYNVSIGAVWHNTTTVTYHNDTGLSAHDWSNVTVWAYNMSGNGSLSTGNISDDVRIPNNVPVLSGLPDNTTDEDVNQTDIFDLDDYYTDADSDNPTYLVESNNQSANVSVTINVSNNVSYTLASGWNGTAEVVINVTDGWGGEDNDMFLIFVDAPPPGDYIPPDPTNLQNTTGNGWVNYTWDAGTPGNITNSYNVSWNSTWYNTTLVTYMNDTVGAFEWANITVWSFNSSGNGSLSAGSVSSDTQAGGGSYTITMTTGVYNLISYYGSANSTAGQFGTDIGNVDYVARYNTVNDTFTTHVVGNGGDNFTTEHGRGYFIFVNVSGSTAYQRNNISDNPYDTSLLQGWNTIGWTNATNTNAEGLIGSIGGNCQYTSMLNADGWSYTTHTLGFTSNNHAIEKGEGYWSWVSVNTNWGRNS